MPDSSNDEAYQEILAYCEAVLGEEVTYEDDLAIQGRYLLGSSFRGVFARDEVPFLPPGAMCIVNMDARHEPGSHWLAMACDRRGEVTLYDSFGRNLAARFPDIDRLIETDPDAEQRVEESNCGARAMAWLCFYALHGPVEARKI